jgi:hypothetical protein
MEEQDGKKRVKSRPTNRKNYIEQSNDYDCLWNLSSEMLNIGAAPADKQFGFN